MPIAKKKTEARVLLVDDEPAVTQSIRQALRKEPFEFDCAASGEQALDLLAHHPFDVIVSDERMPSMQGSELLSIVKERHPDVVRIILSGHASFDAALRAINGAEIYRFLMKPCPPEEIGLTIREALAARQEKSRFEAWRSESRAVPHSELSSRFEQALGLLWIGFQPIVDIGTDRPFGYEALVRSDDPDFPAPSQLFSAADRLGRSLELGQRIRSLVAEQIKDAPSEAVLFVNVNPTDLSDEALLSGADDLARSAERVVLEVTEKDSLHNVPDLDSRISRLREIGYRLAVDDMGAVNAGLGSLVLLVPDIVKFDRELVHGIERSPTKRRLVGPMAKMCRDLGMRALAEGVETRAERDAMALLGCELLQGFYFGPAGRGFTAPTIR